MARLEINRCPCGEKMVLSKMGDKRQRKWWREAWVSKGKEKEEREQFTHHIYFFFFSRIMRLLGGI